MEQSQHFGQTFSPLTSQWSGDQQYQTHQHWPGGSFNESHFGGLPSISLDSEYAGESHLPRSAPQDAQHMLSPPWPSILMSQQPYPHGTYPKLALLPGASGLALTEPRPRLVNPTSTDILPSPSAPAPRRILTDNDRRRMCMYQRDNPEKKQTEIGGTSLTLALHSLQTLTVPQNASASNEGSTPPLSTPPPNHLN